ncbi:uncharacterized protein JCM6883_005327 [Sporobolomyces salmoneus]|uniref:uncharacterized protein n=1 Tax=Sporobolomyces salmoneus TaxID=183962 RepID=UPI00316F8772
MSNLFPLPFKRTHPVDFSTPLISYVSLECPSTHPDHIKSDALRLDQLRREIYGQDGTPLIMTNSLDKLLMYQAQLSLTMEKFPDTSGPSFTYDPIIPPSSSSSASLPPGALPSPTAASNPESSSSSASSSPAIQSLSYEYLSTLYNLSSLYSHLALQHRSSASSSSSSSATTTADSLKTSINHLQSSLGTIDKLISFLPSPQDEGVGRDGDLRREVMEGWREYLRASIQEIGWQKSVIDRLKNGTISKLAKQVSIHYRDCLRFFPSDYLPTEWTKFLKLKEVHFEAVAEFRRSLDDLGANRYGDEIGRLSHSVSILQSTLSDTITLKGKLLKGTSTNGVLETVVKDSKGFLKVLEDNLKRANKDNDLIYLSHPTPYCSLPPITPFPLSRSTPPGLVTSPYEALDRRDRVFAELEKKEVGEVLRVWKDRKLNWVEERVGKEWVKGSGRELNETLNQLNLPASLEENETDSYSSTTTTTTPAQRELKPQPIVPQYLIEQSEEINRLGGISRLKRLFKDVQKVSQINRELLQETDEYLSLPLPTSSSSSPNDLTTSLRDRLSYFSQLISQASSSDSLVRQKFSSVESLLSLLESGPSSLASVIPPPSTPQPREKGREKRRERTREEEELEGEVRKFRRKLRGTIDELRELGDERESFYRRIKSRVEADGDENVRERVIEKSRQLSSAQAQQGGGEPSGLAEYEGVLSGELDRLKRRVEEEGMMRINQKRHRDLIDSLKTLNSSYVSLLQRKLQSQPSSSSSPLPSGDIPNETGNTTTTLTKRQELLQEFSLAHSKYLEILNNLEEGLKFYADLSGLVSELRDQAKQFAYSSTPTTTQTAEETSKEPALENPTQQDEAAGDDSDEPLPDPISAAFSKPISNATPRRSTRHTNSSSTVAESVTATPASERTRTTRETRETKPLRRKSKKLEPEPEPEPEPTREEEREESSVVGGKETGNGGWDPSMGIRFG